VSRQEGGKRVLKYVRTTRRSTLHQLAEEQQVRSLIVDYQDVHRA
jgi:hypothetical protein